MDEAKATAVVERLRARGRFAHLHPVGVYEYSVRIVIPDGREAIWDADGAAGLEAVVLRDGVLVGLVEEVPGSADLDVDGIVEVIARADYDAPLSSRPATPRAARPAPEPPPAPRVRGGLLRRLTGR
ncbi:MAG: hypothetical protein QOE45_648 [Frankiaceae bacterium]|nr:hypothetical protein [Frankiaceae bacterium]